MSQERPAAVKAAAWMCWALVALSAVTAVLSLSLESELVDAWRSSRSDAGAVEPPSIVPVVVVMLIVVVMLMVVLLEFYRARHGWSRIALTATVVMLVLGALACIRIGPPAVFVLVCLLSLVLDAAALVALWHRDTSAYLRAASVRDGAHSPA
jgi:hypothetical protein